MHSGSKSHTTRGVRISLSQVLSGGAPPGDPDAVPESARSSGEDSEFTSGMSSERQAEVRSLHHTIFWDAFVYIAFVGKLSLGGTRCRKPVWSVKHKEVFSWSCRASYSVSNSDTHFRSLYHTAHSLWSSGSITHRSADRLVLAKRSGGYPTVYIATSFRRYR